MNMYLQYQKTRQEVAWLTSIIYSVHGPVKARDRRTW